MEESWPLEVRGYVNSRMQSHTWDMSATTTPASRQKESWQLQGAAFIKGD
jgi:hypothetical protein